MDVNGTASISGALSLYGSPVIASTAKQSLTFGDANTGNIFLSPASATPSFVLTTAGQVGIGTTGPSHKLQVVGGNIAIDAGQQIITNMGAGGNNYLNSANQASPNFDLYAGNVKKLSLGYGTGASSYFNDGNVGIGTVGPEAKLHSYEITALAGTTNNSQILNLFRGKQAQTVMLYITQNT